MKPSVEPLADLALADLAPAGGTFMTRFSSPVLSASLHRISG